MITETKCFLLDEQKGEFVADDGRKISYHKARFYDLDSNSIFKASVPDDADALPEPQVHVVASFNVKAGEKFCKLDFSGYELA